MTVTAEHPGEEILIAFARALRAAGVPVTQDRTATYLAAVSRLGIDDPRATYEAGRATLCAGPEDLIRHDQVFEIWFGRRDELPRAAREQTTREVSAPLPTGDPGEEGGEMQPETVRAVASDVEVLRHRDVAAMSAAEKALLDAMIRSLKPALPFRRSGRRTPWRRGAIDMHRTLRESLQQLGEPGRVHHLRRGIRPRRVVLLVDVSASMRPYADTLLRLAHVLTRVPDGRRNVEVFTLGTRLTRVTAALRTADPRRALAQAGEQVPDWSGGTRLGESLRAFLDRWGSLARGAVVVVLSDGWERGDATELGEQMARLHRLAHRVVWANPHRGKDGYEPVQKGIVAVLPHVDDFVAGHSLRSFEAVLEVVAHA